MEISFTYTVGSASFNTSLDLEGADEVAEWVNANDDGKYRILQEHVNQEVEDMTDIDTESIEEINDNDEDDED